MTEVASRQATRRTALVLATSLFVACDSAREPAGLRLPTAANAGKVSGVTVTAVNPAFGKQGQTNESVTITGSGFATDARASWLRNGVVDTTITVTSTQYISPTTLIATITISPKSPVDFRDVRVMSVGRTPGIGSLLFEVTQAVPIAGTSWVRSINDNGEATGTLSGGNGVFYYKVGTQLETVSPTGTGYDISTAGTAIVGSGGGGAGFPYLYTRTGTGTWQATALPVDASTTSGVARAMLTDGAGQVVQIGGIEYFPVSRNASSTRAVTWIRQAGTASWQRVVLPPGSLTEVRHRAMSANGILGGTADGGHVLGPAVWMPNGSGSYTLTTLAAQGAVNGIRSDGSMIVGFTSGPVYWLAQIDGTWSAPKAVSGGCSGVKDVSDAGRFILNDCPIASGGGQTTAVYSDADYTTLTRLGGLGPKSNVGFASGISHGGRYAGGYANVNNQGSVGIYWTLP